MATSDHKHHVSSILRGVDVTTPGTIKVWRVEKFTLAEVPPAVYGTFMQGDSYVVLHLSSTTPVKRTVYFWQGKDSSPDEKASSAILAQAIDDELGGSPVQVREAQGEESEGFRALWRGGLNFKHGGVASGFRAAGSSAGAGAKLFIIKSPSRTSTQVVEVVAAVASLASNASFVLDNDAGGALYVWHGAEANLREKMKAVDTANAFRSNRGAMRLAVLDQDDVASADAAAFYKLLGAGDARAAAASITPRDGLPEAVGGAGGSAASGSAAAAPARLFRLTPSTQELPAPPSRAHLDTHGQYALVANGQVWVWAGAKAGPADKAAGEKLAASVGLKGGEVAAVKEHLEPGVFCAQFPDWTQCGEYASGLAATQAAKAAQQAVTSPGKGGAPAPEEPDYAAIAKAMVAQAAAAASSAGGGGAAASKPWEGVVAEGPVTVWVARRHALEPVPEGEAANFFDAEAYVVLHEYKARGEDRQSIYFWQGRHATALEQGTAALLATDMHHEKFKGTSALIRVAQNAEPPHFTALFRGALCVHKGDRVDLRAGGLPSGTRLYHVKAEGAASVRAVEVDRAAASLNSGDAYVLKLSEFKLSGVMLWAGKAAAPAELEVAARVAASLALGGDYTTVKEGEEPEAFWNALGGQGDYPHVSERRAAATPVLFHVRDAAIKGGAKVEAHASFSQEELCATDAMLLAAGGDVFVWAGPQAGAGERARAHKIADAYIRARNQGQANIIDVEAGAEPPFFTCHFAGWDSAEQTGIEDVYEKKMQLKAEQEAAATQ